MKGDIQLCDNEGATLVEEERCHSGRDQYQPSDNNQLAEPLLTIAIPTFNRASLLARALDSIFAQLDDIRMSDVEVLVSDNASTDSTGKVIVPYAFKYGVVYYRNETNIGADGNFLACYERAKGKYVMLLGSDDVLLPGALTSIISFLISNCNVDLVFLNQLFFKGDYRGIKNCWGPFVPEEHDDEVTTDKSHLIDVASHRFTFMSCWLVRKNKLLLVSNKSKYMNTSFIHTCLFFEVTKESDSVLGIVYQPCIANDVTVENTNYNVERFCRVFGARMHYVLCEVAPACGYSLRDMEGVYSYFLKGWPRSIGGFKANGEKVGLQEYGMYIKPCLVGHGALGIFLRTCCLIPGPVWSLMRDFYRLVRRR